MPLKCTVCRESRDTQTTVKAPSRFRLIVSLYRDRTDERAESGNKHQSFKIQRKELACPYCPNAMTRLRHSHTDTLDQMQLETVCGTAPYGIPREGTDIYAEAIRDYRSLFG